MYKILTDKLGEDFDFHITEDIEDQFDEFWKEFAFVLLVDEIFNLDCLEDCYEPLLSLDDGFDIIYMLEEMKYYLVSNLQEWYQSEYNHFEFSPYETIINKCFATGKFNETAISVVTMFMTKNKIEYVKPRQLLKEYDEQKKE